MSKIALFVDDFGEHKARCIMLISKVFCSPASVIKKNFEDGLPVAQHKLFDRHSIEFAGILLDALEQLTAMNCHWHASELLDDQIWEPSTKYYQITPDRLSNMITARSESVKQQRRIADLEEGEDHNG